MRESKGLLKCKMNIFMLAVLAMMLGAVFVTAVPRQVQAAVRNGWYPSEDDKQYFYRDGEMLKGQWKGWGGDWYYLKDDGSVMKNEFKSSVKGNTYYMGSAGCRVFGWQEIKDSTGNKNWFYFEPKTEASTSGRMFTGLNYIGKKRYCFRTKADKDGAAGAAMTGTAKARAVITATNGKKYLAAKYSKKGAFKTGFVVTNGKKRCYSPKVGLWIDRWINYKGAKYRADKDGVLLTGWQTIDGERYYFITSGSDMGQAIVNKSYEIAGITYEFDKNGVCAGSEGATGSDLVAEPSSGKTIKNFLLGALQPVGNTLYIWGGGHDEADATRKGVNPQWGTFFNKNASKSYDYNNFRFAYGKGVDCSGYVGWCIYQVMEKKSGGTMYTTVSGEVGDMAVSKGYGKTYAWSQLTDKFKAGDIGYDENHTWIVLGQCSDKSLVILHSTPPGGVQIAGSPTPSGDYNSNAAALAQKYMKKYTKFYSIFGAGNTGNYARRGRYMRWTSTSKGLTDPDGYKSMSAAAILEDLFASK